MLLGDTVVLAVALAGLVFVLWLLKVHKNKLELARLKIDEQYKALELAKSMINSQADRIVELEKPQQVYRGEALESPEGWERCF